MGVVFFFFMVILFSSCCNSKQITTAMVSLIEIQTLRCVCFLFTFKRTFFFIHCPHETASCLLLNSAWPKKVETNGVRISGILVMPPLGSSKLKFGFFCYVEIFKDHVKLSSSFYLAILPFRSWNYLVLEKWYCFSNVLVNRPGVKGHRRLQVSRRWPRSLSQ